MNSKILLVEDDPQWQLIISRALKLVDPKLLIDTVTNVSEAKLSLFLNPDYSLVISDYFLEGHQSGLDLWKVSQHNSHMIPYLFVSGLQKSEFEILFDQMDPDHGNHRPFYMSKPFDLEKLKRIVGWQLRSPVHWS